jgi:hypothetical protein
MAAACDRVILPVSDRSNSLQYTLRFLPEQLTECVRACGQFEILIMGLVIGYNVCD